MAVQIAADTRPISYLEKPIMRSNRVVLLVLLAALVLAPAACTNPTGPKPAGDDVSVTKI